MLSIDKFLYLLLQGFVLGFGPCLFICAPIVVPYIAGTKRSWQEGLKATLIFSLARLLVYAFLGGIFGYFGFFLLQLYPTFSLSIWLIGAAFIILLGGLIILGRDIRNPLCQLLSKQTLDDSFKSMVFLGVIVGLSPCLPLVGILMEIALISEHIWIGALYGATFGIGTVISPLLILGALAGGLPTAFIHNEKIFRIFNVICGILLILVGLYILFSRLL